MTGKSLADILCDGSIVDNTVHQLKDGKLTWNKGAVVTTFRRDVKEGRNHPNKVWPLLCKAELIDVSDSLVVARGEDYEDNTEGQLIELRGRGWEDFTLTTGNLIGCVRDGDYSLKISSRFGDEFLKFIIADADGFKELSDQGAESQGDYEWLLIYLWQIKLKKAFRLGLPKGYETRSESLTTVRGRLDPVDYALNAERGRYRCTYREHSYDNDATRLIACTIKHLDGHAYLRGAHGLNQTFQTATSGARHPLSELLAAKPVKNPYFAEYNEVMTLSKRILRNKLADFGSNSQTSAFFFDVSMLFEYFMRNLFQRAGARFREKNGGSWRIPTGGEMSARKLIPDLVFELNGRTFIFDVKYKSFDFRYGVKREDNFQLHTYLGHISNEGPVSGCGLIYPILESRWNSQNMEKHAGLVIEKINQHGSQVPFYVAFLRVPDSTVCTSKQEFSASFQSSCEEFVQQLFGKLRPSTPIPSKLSLGSTGEHNAGQWG
jgi:5-methylcytosine-specific restriction enzyme subunit McrC